MVLEARSPHRQHPHHLGTCWKGTFSGLSPETESETPGLRPGVCDVTSPAGDSGAAEAREPGCVSEERLDVSRDRQKDAGVPSRQTACTTDTLWRAEPAQVSGRVGGAGRSGGLGKREQVSVHASPPTAKNSTDRRARV